MSQSSFLFHADQDDGDHCLSHARGSLSAGNLSRKSRQHDFPFPPRWEKMPASSFLRSTSDGRRDEQTSCLVPPVLSDEGSAGSSGGRGCTTVGSPWSRGFLQHVRPRLHTAFTYDSGCPVGSGKPVDYDGVWIATHELDRIYDLHRETAMLGIGAGFFFVGGIFAWALKLPGMELPQDPEALREDKSESKEREKAAARARKRAGAGKADDSDSEEDDAGGGEDAAAAGDAEVLDGE
mmetsp:Transcript_18893/g.47206  ORF Transcript_18893/g.47206 Transcript_18893/m.47206 type:complete len:237 (+) Transcript_18893:189-899(+)|eukprot:CAMPEP_0178993710 /NCGR_PEP_ID=MMETSP0795-20121207/6857_1 /TAXON_ID=88552 /ORGANISM="Amoebophrya sp., Strain Ameob2" /LENGTH=236 /DNA_ID=CAMNT_0020685805 /DNA_START=142 /DNA_END=852 /DNA_ORIENTATION=+